MLIYRYDIALYRVVSFIAQRLVVLSASMWLYCLALFNVHRCREFRSTAGHCGSVQTDAMRSPRNWWERLHYLLNYWWVVSLLPAKFLAVVFLVGHLTYLLLSLPPDSVGKDIRFLAVHRVCTDPGKSWNFIVQNSRPWKVLEKA